MQQMMRKGGVVLLSVVAMAACGGGRDNETANGDTGAPVGTVGQGNVAGGAGTAAPPAGAGGEATPADSATTPGSPVPTSTAQMTDPEIVSLTQAADEGEIATSQVALTKASNAEVRRYAQEMVTVHRRMISQRNGQLKASGAAPAAGAKDSSKATADAMLAKLREIPRGAAFDTAYVNGQVVAHEATLQMVRRAQGMAQDAALKTTLTTAAPEIQKHLEEARALQGKLASGAQ